MINVTKKLTKNIIVIDNNSTDKTAEIAKKHNAEVIIEKKVGLGNALRKGFQVSTSRDYDIIVTMDADGQHDPTEIKKIVEPIKNGYDFCLGTRKLSNYPPRKKFGNIFLTFITNLLCNTSFSDTESGFRAFDAEFLEKITPHLTAEKYQIAMDIIFEIGKRNINYREVKVSSPKYSEGTTIASGIENLCFLLRKVFSASASRVKNILLSP